MSELSPVMAGDTDESSDILERIEKMIEANGTIPQSAKDRLMFVAIASVVRANRELNKSMKEIADKLCVDEVKIKAEMDDIKDDLALLRWIRKNPTPAAIAFLIFIAVYKYLQAAIEAWLGLPPGSIP